MSKHTPGPWHVDEHNDVSSKERHVATPSFYGDDSDDANANLIAAAPDLLAALLAFDVSEDGEHCFCDEHPHVARCNSARAAIAKAKGETK